MSPIDYMDGDVAYLLGMLVARGELSSSENVFRMIVHFPKGSLQAQGTSTEFDTDKEIRLGITKIRERLLELLGGDVRVEDAGEHWDLVLRSTRRTMAWRNVLMLLNDRTTYRYFEIPDVLMDPAMPAEYKREFVRGYADVAANIRRSNYDQAGRHRVRLDTLNYPSNWRLPVQLCLLLQEHLGVGVPAIIWGHPNLGREWREHQLNVYAEDFLRIGFYFDYKQQALEELAQANRALGGSAQSPCPGQRRVRGRKPADPEEGNAERLDVALVGQHFDAYWQICRALGCPRRPPPGQQLEMLLEDGA
jgi:hypothetical protein